MPRQVTIVVIAGGSRPDLTECLLSLREVRYGNAAALVVDNSLSGLGEELRTAFPEVDLARGGALLTFAQAANFGLARAFSTGCEVALLLNDDTTVHQRAPGALEEAEREGGPGLYAPEIWPYEPRSERERFAFDWGKRLVVRRPAEMSGKLTPLDYAEASALLVSREVFEKLGGFDEDFGFYFEDADFSVRAHEAGFPVMEVAGARVWHKGSLSAGRGLSPFKAYFRARNAPKFAFKHRDRAHVGANLAYHAADFLIPQALRALPGVLVGRRRSAGILAALASGTLDSMTGRLRHRRRDPGEEDSLPGREAGC